MPRNWLGETSWFTVGEFGLVSISLKSGFGIALMPPEPPMPPEPAMPPIDPRDRLIVALDVASRDEARTLVDRIGDEAAFYKIGFRLGFAGGLALVDTRARLWDPARHAAMASSYASRVPGPGARALRPGPVGVRQ